ncbi:TSUP family transporter, partial [Streptomyces nigra]
MNGWDFGLLTVAATGAGAVNAVVGSGSLITFPALVAMGYPPILATVSNNVGLVPGMGGAVYGYRRELTGQGGLLLRLAVAAGGGALIGSFHGGDGSGHGDNSRRIGALYMTPTL